ncbi:MAG: heparinase II/III family protein, partial [Candidatus Kapaibacterium sp.]
DHRSGTSWSEGLPAGMLRITPRPGADPKNPWDVARIHHALQVALAYGIESDTARRDALAEDFRSRVLDFLSTNPPGYGINWTVAMEVAIRMANVLLAFHVFRLHGRTFDDAFTDVLARGMAEHAEWVLEHHEWSEGMRGNHFFGNLAGLSVCAAFLGPCDLRDRIDVFVTRHLDAELLYQFHPDGSHFEASLAYHFFSAEMLAWSYACRYLRDPGHVPAPELQTRLRAVHAFSMAMCGSGGIVPQIGDNDTGRFLPLLPFHATDHDAARPLRRPDVVALTGLVADPTVSGLQDVLDTILRSWSTLASRPDAAGPVMIRADDFGIAVCRTSRCEWYLRAGSVGQYGRGGHAHNDQLSFVFLVDGREILTDPGTYTYTAVPTERNRFRSTSSHNTLVVDGAEQHGLPRDLREGLFWICSDKAKGRMVRAENGTWIGRHTGYGAPHTRTMEFGDHDFRIIDECECAEPKRIVFHCHPDVRVEHASDHVLVCHRDGIQVRIESAGGVIACESSSYSPEYGVLVPTTRIVIPMDHSRHEVRFTVAER